MVVPPVSAALEDSHVGMVVVYWDYKVRLPNLVAYTTIGVA